MVRIGYFTVYINYLFIFINFVGDWRGSIWKVGSDRFVVFCDGWFIVGVLNI